MESLSTVRENTHESDKEQSVTLTDNQARQLAVLALLSVLNNDNNEEYVSGPGFPNIPFGD